MSTYMATKDVECKYSYISTVKYKLFCVHNLCELFVILFHVLCVRNWTQDLINLKYILHHWVFAKFLISSLFVNLQYYRILGIDPCICIGISTPTTKYLLLKNTLHLFLLTPFSFDSTIVSWVNTFFVSLYFIFYLWLGTSRCNFLFNSHNHLNFCPFVSSVIISSFIVWRKKRSCFMTILGGIERLFVIVCSREP